MGPFLRFILPATLLLLACQEAPPAAKVEASASPVEPQSAATAADRLDRSHRGRLSPESQFEDPEGEPASLSDFRGRPLLVNLWATWCVPCVTEMPTLDALARSEEGKLHVLALSQDLEGRPKVDAFFAKRRFTTLEPFIDPQMTLMTELKVESLPTTILYDAQGREVWRIAGIEDWTSPRVARLIREASAG